MAVQDADLKAYHDHLKRPHFEIYAYALNLKQWRYSDYRDDRDDPFYTTERAFKDQVACGFAELFSYKLVEKLPLSLIYKAMAEIIERPYGRAYTTEQFTEALLELHKIVGHRPEARTIMEALQDEEES